MGFKTSGTLHTLGEAKQVSARFRKREFVIELADNPRYPQLVMFQLTGDRCEQLDNFKVGDAVDLDFALRGREWKSPQGELKYFNSLDVWTVEPASGGGQSSGGGGSRGQGGGGQGGGGGGGPGDPPPPAEPDEKFQDKVVGNFDDDIPF